MVWYIHRIWVLSAYFIYIYSISVVIVGCLLSFLFSYCRPHLLLYSLFQFQFHRNSYLNACISREWLSFALMFAINYERIIKIILYTYFIISIHQTHIENTLAMVTCRNCRTMHEIATINL